MSSTNIKIIDTKVLKKIIDLIEKDKDINDQENKALAEQYRIEKIFQDNEGKLSRFAIKCYMRAADSKVDLISKFL